jgi:hypothetical protein
LFLHGSVFLSVLSHLLSFLVSGLESIAGEIKLLNSG